MSSEMGFPLLKLPPELQLKIYANSFRSLHPAFPHFPAPPLLLTCRSVYTAAQPLYMRNTTLDLKILDNLVDYLTSLFAPQIKQLRHLSLCAAGFQFYMVGCWVTHHFKQLWRVVSNLQLDTLTITDGRHGLDVREDAWRHWATYDEVQSIIERGCGWRKLFYRSESTLWLQPAEFFYPATNGDLAIQKTTTQGQPGHWDRMIKQRDGPGSGAGVRMWVQTNGDWVEVPAIEGQLDVEEDEFDWDRTELQSSENMYGNGDGSLQIEIQITRGRDADIIDKGDHLRERELHGLWKTMGLRRMADS